VYLADRVGDQSVHYNTRCYLSPTLPNGQHTLVVTNLLIAMNSDSFFIDYFLISKSDADPSFSPKSLTTTASSSAQSSGSAANTPGRSEPSSNTGTIVGAALGAAALIIVAVAFILWLRGRNKRATKKPIDSRCKLFLRPFERSHGYGTVRDDQESPPARTAQTGHAFASTASDTAQPYGAGTSLRFHPAQTDALPPDYTPDVSQTLNPLAVQGSGNGVSSKLVYLNYNTSSGPTSTSS
jgi:hypothetical protein